MSDLETYARGGVMSDPRKDPTLTDEEIETRRVDDAKPGWETPRLTELGVSGSGGLNTGFTEDHPSAPDDGTGPS
jgi:hypothetical protein